MLRLGDIGRYFGGFCLVRCGSQVQVVFRCSAKGTTVYDSQEKESYAERKGNESSAAVMIAKTHISIP